ncbi:MAG: hypothetical protein A4E26_00346 [Methanobacterium sp. PtaU1.Bin097]|jgi:hypothetical protein|nr:MAG: hypothetical protein A4E26_00346 [Methanobacterium sp. PtaU1.Bin097]
MVTWLIRAVDWGNIQRSPTFQAIFNYFFSDSSKLTIPVIFDSAGTRVDDIMGDSTPVTKKLDMIHAGIHYDIVKGADKSLADDFLSKWYGKDETHIPLKEKRGITRIYSKIKTDVHLEQMRFRNVALMEAGIPEEFLPGMRVPFRHNKNLRLILPLEENIVQQVEDYYKSSSNKQPLTKIYGDLVGIDYLEDELVGGIKTARKQVEYFMNTRDEAMEEITKLLG